MDRAFSLAYHVAKTPATKAKKVVDATEGASNGDVPDIGGHGVEDGNHDHRQPVDPCHVAGGELKSQPPGVSATAPVTPRPGPSALW
jgi:hypothetical protein